MKDLSYIVHLDLEADGVEPVLQAQVQALHRAGHIEEVQTPLRLLKEREAVHSTAMGSGAAFPHARWDGCPKPVASIARLKGEIDFGAPELGPVDIVFLLLGPEDNPSGHVRILGKFASLVRNQEAMAALRRARDEADFRDKLDAGLTGPVGRSS